MAGAGFSSGALCAAPSFGGWSAQGVQPTVFAASHGALPVAAALSAPCAAPAHGAGEQPLSQDHAAIDFGAVRDNGGLPAPLHAAAASEWAAPPAVTQHAAETGAFLKPQRSTFVAPTLGTFCSGAAPAWPGFPALAVAPAVPSCSAAPVAAATSAAAPAFAGVPATAAPLSAPQTPQHAASMPCPSPFGSPQLAELSVERACEDAALDAPPATPPRAPSPAPEAFTPRANPRRLFFRAAAPALPALESETVATQTEAQPEPCAAPCCALPSIADPAFFCEPSIAALAAQEAARPGSLRSVAGLVLGRSGVGRVRFLAPVDLSDGPALDEVLVFSGRAVGLYPDAPAPPPHGTRLNVAAEVTLLRVFSSKKRARSSSSSSSSGGSGSATSSCESADADADALAAAKAARAFRRRLEAAPGTRFVAYDAAEGTWRFRVDHF
jgi:hypothetical protein